MHDHELQLINKNLVALTICSFFGLNYDYYPRNDYDLPGNCLKANCRIEHLKRVVVEISKRFAMAWREREKYERRICQLRITDVVYDFNWKPEGSLFFSLNCLHIF